MKIVLPVGGVGAVQVVQARDPVGGVGLQEGGKQATLTLCHLAGLKTDTLRTRP